MPNEKSKSSASTAVESDQASITPVMPQIEAVVMLIKHGSGGRT